MVRKLLVRSGISRIKKYQKNEKCAQHFQRGVEEQYRRAMQIISEPSRLNVLKLAWPLILASASDVIMTTVDMAFVGHLGTVQIAAVGLSGLFIWATYNLFKGILICVGTMTSQNYGAKRYADSVAALYNGLFIAFLAALFLLFYRYATPTLFTLMKPSQAIQEVAIGYTNIRLFGAFGFLSCIAFAGFFRGIGRPRIILRVSIVMNLLNALLDYLFIFIFDLGVFGAALATAVSQFTGMFLYITCFSFSKLENIPVYIRLPIIKYGELKKLLRIGVPFSLKIFSEVFIFFLFTVMVGRLGDAQLAATTIMIQILTFTNMTALGFGQAGEVVVGQNIGARRYDDAVKSGQYSIELNAFFTIGFSVVLLLFPKAICSIFNQDPLVAAYFSLIVFFGVVEVCFDGLQMVAGGCLGGAGDTKVQFYIMLFLGYLFFLPMVYIFAFELKLGVFGAWLASAVFILIFAVLLYYRFRSRAWKKIVLVEAL